MVARRLAPAALADRPGPAGPACQDLQPAQARPPDRGNLLLSRTSMEHSSGDLNRWRWPAAVSFLNDLTAQPVAAHLLDMATRIPAEFLRDHVKVSFAAEILVERRIAEKVALGSHPDTPISARTSRKPFGGLEKLATPKEVTRVVESRNCVTRSASYTRMSSAWASQQSSG